MEFFQDLSKWLGSLIGIVVFVVVYGIRQGQIDSCLDRGGKWAYETAICTNG